MARKPSTVSSHLISDEQLCNFYTWPIWTFELAGNENERGWVTRRSNRQNARRVEDQQYIYLLSFKKLPWARPECRTRKNILEVEAINIIRANKNLIIIFLTYLHNPTMLMMMMMLKYTHCQKHLNRIVQLQENFNITFFCF